MEQLVVVVAGEGDRNSTIARELNPQRLNSPLENYRMSGSTISVKRSDISMMEVPDKSGSGRIQLAKAQLVTHAGVERTAIVQYEAPDRSKMKIEEISEKISRLMIEQRLAECSCNLTDSSVAPPTKRSYVVYRNNPQALMSLGREDLEAILDYLESRQEASKQVEEADRPIRTQRLLEYMRALRMCGLTIKAPNDPDAKDGEWKVDIRTAKGIEELNKLPYDVLLDFALDVERKYFEF